jgi:hypothetical protein
VYAAKEKPVLEIDGYLAIGGLRVYTRSRPRVYHESTRGRRAPGDVSGLVGILALSSVRGRYLRNKENAYIRLYVNKVDC